MQQLIIRLFSALIVFVGLVSGAFAAGDPCRDVGVAGWCNLFDDITVQEEAAKGLVKAAMKEDLVDKNTSGQYQEKGTFDKVADGQYKYKDSAGAVHVFQFESFNLPAGMVESERVAIKSAICKLYGGQSSNSESVCYMNSELPGVESAHLYNDLQQFGMYSRWVPESVRQVVGNRTTTVKSHYEFSAEFETDDFDSEQWSFVYGGNEIINPNVFSSLQIKDLASVKDYLIDYIMLRFSMAGIAVNNVACASSTIKVKNKFLAPDDFLPCSVTYYAPEKGMMLDANIGFVFDDIAETRQSVSSAGGAMLACNAAGGSATQKGVCAGFTKQMCDTLRVETGVDTEWNTEKGGCILTAQNGYNRQQKVKNFIIAATGIAVGVLTLPLTGGTSAMVVVAIIAGVATIVGTVSSTVANEVMDVRFTAALLGANKCWVENCASVSGDDGTVRSVSCTKCAPEAAENLVKAMVEYEGTFSDTDAEVAVYLLDLLLGAYKGFMFPICLQEVADNVEKSDWQNVANIGNAVALIGTVLSVPTWFSRATSSTSTIGDKITNSFHSSAKNLSTTLGAIGKTKRISNLANKMKRTAIASMQALSKGIAKISGRGKKVNVFADKLSTLDGGVNSSGNIMKAWNYTCPRRGFPCDKTITNLLSDFDGLCVAN